MRPILFSLGSFDFFAAPVFAGLSSLVAFLYVRRWRSHADLSVEQLWSLMMALAVGTMLGGILLYMLAYGGGLENNIAYLLKRHRIRGGAFFGNFWAAVLVAWLFARKRGLRFPALADLLGGAAPLALVVMRLGCLQHGCCYGRPTDLPWAIVFDHPRAALRRVFHEVPLHPYQIYEALGALAVFLIVHRVVFRRVREGELPEGSAFAASASLYAVLRFFLDFTRGGDRGVFRPFGLSTAQVLALLTLAAAVALYRRVQTQSKG